MTTDPRFDFIDCLGRGGFGEVYRARMRAPSGEERLVAVKVLHERARDVPKAIQRLRDEAHLLAALHHRSIVQVLDLVEIHERLALVTEYIEGSDLFQVLREDHCLPATAALEMIGEVAGALHAAWTAPAPQTTTPMRLVHRDIKPANIRLTPAGNVKLLDFGIARSPEIDREARTTTGVVVGTVGYFSPERLTEDIPQPSDDVYALGCVLFECLTGERLYRDMKRSDLFRLAFHASVHGEFINRRLDAAEEQRTVPASVRRLLTRVLASEACDRPTAGELALECADLARLVDGPVLRDWSQQRNWTPPAVEAGGRLDGQSVETRPLLPPTVDAPGAPPNLAAVLPPSATNTESPTVADLPAAPTVRPRPRPRPAPPPASSGGARALGLVLLLCLLGGGGAWVFLQERASGLRSSSSSLPAASTLDPSAGATDLPAAGTPKDDTASEAEEPPRLPPNPSATPPAAIPADLQGDQLLTLRGGRLEMRDLDSPARQPRRLSLPSGPVASVCLSRDVLAVAVGPVVEVRTVAKDAVLDRIRPGGQRIDRVLCLDNGEIAAVSRTARKGSGGDTAELIWWDSQGRVKGRLLPPQGVVDAIEMGDRILVLDMDGGLRSWEGKGGATPERVPLPDTPLGFTPSLGGPAWVATAESVCSAEGACVQVDARRGLLASGVGWVAVAGPDRITVIDATGERILRDLAAAPAALFARPDGSLVVVEPTGVRILDPVTGVEHATRPW